MSAFLKPLYPTTITYGRAAPPVQHQQFTPAWDDHAAGTPVSVDWSQSVPLAPTAPRDLCVACFVSQRVGAPPSVRAISGPRQDYISADALVAFRDNLAVVMGASLSDSEQGAQSFFLSGSGRTIHPHGYEVCAIRVVRPPSQLMQELLMQPSDPRNLYVLAAAVATSGRPVLHAVWCCGTSADAAITRWRDSTHGIAGPGERLVCVTPMLITRAAMEGTLRHPPTAID